ncbi:MAG: 1-acyl-sn-glycerol-3-phosphate acyltransferase [Archangium sp.]|nr:1-acyl-sn-glycerol-3-phosphate acyltransferase [Archangium sp.]
MFYRAFRAVSALALRLFFRVEPPIDPTGALTLEGPVMYVGNHPNGLMDPGFMLILAQRRVTFLAKEPLFRMPVLGQIMRGMDALPIYRKQDGPGDTSKNEGTLTASVDALLQGRAITLFPEGKSHSEPQLAELKTGAARIALEAARKGAAVRLVPVGITYEAKNRFKSRVHVEVAPPLPATDFLEAAGEDPHQAAVRFTEAIAAALRQVTLNLDAWEDLPILETAEALYALSHRERAGSAERQKAFARGMSLLRNEQPERFEKLKNDLAAYRARLELLRVSADDLTSQYRPGTVAFFIARNLFSVLSIPLVLTGFALFAIPYHLPLLAVKAVKPEKDTESTVKVLTLLLLAPLWWALLVALAGWAGGLGFAIATLLAVPPLALFTRYYLERRAAAWHDARTFFVLLSRQRVKAGLLEEGQALAAEVEGLVQELAPRLGQA